MFYVSTAGWICCTVAIATSASDCRSKASDGWDLLGEWDCCGGVDLYTCTIELDFAKST